MLIKFLWPSSRYKSLKSTLVWRVTLYFDIFRPEFGPLIEFPEEKFWAKHRCLPIGSEYFEIGLSFKHMVMFLQFSLIYMCVYLVKKTTDFI